MNYKLTHKAIYIVYAVLAGCMLISVIAPALAFGQEREYVQLAPLPGTADRVTQEGSVTNFSTYVEGAFRLFIGVAGILAVVVIVYAGFTYMTTDAIQGKSEAKHMIKNAILGLLLAAGSWIILQTIGGDSLTEITLDIDRPVITRPTVDLSLSCDSCTSLYIYNIPVKPGVAGYQVQRNLADKLFTLHEGLTSQNISWRVTEAFPPEGYSTEDPTGIHVASCHGDGTCVDANFINRNPTPNEITAFFQAAENAELEAEYEVRTTAEKEALEAAGVTGVIKVIPQITANHFSVYNR